MTEGISRREFLSGGTIRKAIMGWLGKAAAAQDSKEESLRNYFQSPLHSYPLLQEMPWELLLAEAMKHDIPTADRTKNEIARDLFIKISKLEA